jgi:hypothetical protein
VPGDSSFWDGMPWAMAVLAFFVLAALAGVIYYVRDAGPRRVRRLRARYLALLHQPPGRAEETLLRQLEGLAEREPGRSMEWYLAWLTKSLLKDRRA